MDAKLVVMIWPVWRRWRVRKKRRKQCDVLCQTVIDLLLDLFQPFSFCFWQQKQKKPVMRELDTHYRQKRSILYQYPIPFACICITTWLRKWAKQKNTIVMTALEIQRTSVRRTSLRRPYFRQVKFFKSPLCWTRVMTIISNTSVKPSKDPREDLS